MGRLGDLKNESHFLKKATFSNVDAGNSLWQTTPSETGHEKKSSLFWVDSLYYLINYHIIQSFKSDLTYMVIFTKFWKYSKHMPENIDFLNIANQCPTCRNAINKSIQNHFKVWIPKGGFLNKDIPKNCPDELEIWICCLLLLVGNLNFKFRIVFWNISTLDIGRFEKHITLSEKNHL